jgi:hypothetical protein
LEKRFVEAQQALDIALHIGRRLCGQARWQGQGCTWRVVPAAAARPGGARRADAGPDLYQGTAGLAWFLGELAARSGEEELRRTAAGALTHALSWEWEKEADFSFYSGRVGVAYVAHHLGGLLEEPSWQKAARDLLLPLAGREGEDLGLDVISGAAGAIAPLLVLASEQNEPAWLAMARALGDRLWATAHRDPGGWGWGSPFGSETRCLLGWAHGASGIGTALLELAYATGEGRYRLGAELAFLYERSFFVAAESNWPDLRHPLLMELVPKGLWDTLRRRFREERFPPYRPAFMSAWCHGAPGIGLARLRAWQLTGQEIYRREAESALAGALDSLGPRAREAGNFSLCHGLAGNADVVLEVARGLGRDRLPEPVRQVAELGWRRFGEAGRPWPSGAFGAAPDPSLLLGEAGVGFFYLRLADPETPSPLQIRPRPLASTHRQQEAGYGLAGRELMEEAFGATVKAWNRFLPTPWTWAPVKLGREPVARTPAAIAHGQLQRRLDRAEEPTGTKLRQALRRQEQAFLMAAEMGDFVDELRQRLLTPALEEIRWPVDRFQLRASCRLLAPSRAGAAAVLLYRQDHRIHDRDLSPLAAAVLAAIQEEGSLVEVVERVAAQGRVGSLSDLWRLRCLVRQQLEELIRAGWVRVPRLEGRAGPDFTPEATPETTPEASLALGVAP